MGLNMESFDPAEFLVGRSNPSRESCVLRYALTYHAERSPDKIFAIFEDGSSWTNGETLARTKRAASAFFRLGIRQGDRVLSWLSNSPEALLVWFASNWLGAVYTPINISYRGPLLEHVIAKSQAQVMVVEDGLVERLYEINLGQLDTVVIIGRATAPGSLKQVDGSILSEFDDEISLERPIEPWDTGQIIYTSGTTGPSKGVLISYLHLATSAFSAFAGRVHPNIRYMVNLPLFHAGGTIGSYAMLLLGGSISLVQSFKTETFWPAVRTTETTCCTLLGVMATFLMKEPEKSDDQDNPLKWVYMIPLLESSDIFSQRFKVTVYTMFNMTEVSCPLISEANPEVKGACGEVRTGVEIRLVDENDFEVPEGTVGEMVIRTDRPWSLNHGYLGEPEATAKAWRNGWYHTGDGFRRDAEGNFFFVDRMKDTIRRRGENISSFEVEAVITTHPEVLEAAVVGVPSEFSENEVLAFVVPVPGANLDFIRLIEFLRERMAHFMVPRYIRIVEQLPKTPTNKIQKHLLRKTGVDNQTWDREAAGILLKKEKFVR
jgi:crotonobetaine/carnitine-CoA ligase